MLAKNHPTARHYELENPELTNKYIQASRHVRISESHGLLPLLFWLHPRQLLRKMQYHFRVLKSKHQDMQILWQ